MRHDDRDARIVAELLVAAADAYQLETVGLQFLDKLRTVHCVYYTHWSARSNTTRRLPTDPVAWSWSHHPKPGIGALCTSVALLAVFAFERGQYAVQTSAFVRLAVDVAAGEDTSRVLRRCRFHEVVLRGRGRVRLGGVDCVLRLQRFRNIVRKYSPDSFLSCRSCSISNGVRRSLRAGGIAGFVGGGDGCSVDLLSVFIQTSRIIRTRSSIYRGESIGRRRS
jgi:hypothetical protein